MPTLSGHSNYICLFLVGLSISYLLLSCLAALALIPTSYSSYQCLYAAQPGPAIPKPLSQAFQAWRNPSIVVMSLPASYFALGTCISYPRNYPPEPSNSRLHRPTRRFRLHVLVHPRSERLSRISRDGVDVHHPKLHRRFQWSKLLQAR